MEDQAREVVAFALAASADPAAYRALEGELKERPYGWQGAGDSWWWNDSFWVAVGWSPTTATQWSKSGATHGLRIADHLDDVTVLHQEWDRWQDPATSADELLATFNLDPLPTPQELAEAKGFDAPDEAVPATDSPAAPC